jgi:hypothetical protein
MNGATSMERAVGWVVFGFNLLKDLREIERFWCLERRELLERLQVQQPQLLPCGQNVEVTLEAVDGAASEPPV